MPLPADSRGLIVPSVAVKVFLWFAADEDTRTTHRVLVVAASLEQARRTADALPIAPNFKKWVMEHDPEHVSPFPYALYDASREGKAFSVQTG